MINPVLTYLRDFYGDGQFYDLTPLINQSSNTVSETAIHNLHLEGLIEVQEPSAFENAEDANHKHPMRGRLTERGMFFLEGDQKAATVMSAINNQQVLDILYRDEDGHEERVALSPYIYGKDPEEKAVVWGAVAGHGKKHRRFQLEDVTITDEPTGTFAIDHEMKLSQPRDIDVIAQVEY